MKHLSQLLVPALLVCALGAQASPVNINTADAVTLARELKGVGEHKAQAIVAYRQQHGAFHNVDELALVKGIGPKLIERNRADIRLSGGNLPATAPAAATQAAGRAGTVRPAVTR